MQQTKPVACLLYGSKNTAQIDWLRAFAAVHALPVLDKPPTELAGNSNPLLLHYAADGALSLAHAETLAHPVSIDLQHYLRQLENNRLLRLSGLSHAKSLSVCDATAGFGKDAWVLTHHAHSATWIERDPIVHALLADAHGRATTIATTKPVADKARLVCADAAEYLLGSAGFDLVYLDPMFSSTKRQAKKPVQLLRSLHTPAKQEENSALLSAALASARKKVVVKRHKKDLPLAHPTQPSYSNCAKSVCFDVYTVA